VEQICVLKDEQAQIKRDILARSGFVRGDHIIATKGVKAGFKGEVTYITVTSTGKVRLSLLWKFDQNHQPVNTQYWYDTYGTLTSDKVRKI
jgi:hypothetical protein